MRDVIIATFRSENAPTNLNWIATLNQHNRRLPVIISGASEEFVIAEARRMWEFERSKYKRETGNDSPVFARLASEPVIDTVVAEPKAGNAEPDAAAPTASRRGGNRAGGLIWMINAERTARSRVSEAEFAKFAAEGWTRGGPRSKLVSETA